MGAVKLETRTNFIFYGSRYGRGKSYAKGGVYTKKCAALNSARMHFVSKLTDFRCPQKLFYVYKRGGWGESQRVIEVDILSLIRQWHFRDGLSIREIAHRTKLSRYTFSKYLADDDIEPA